MFRDSIFKNQKKLEWLIIYRLQKGGGGKEEDKIFKLSRNEKAAILILLKRGNSEITTDTKNETLRIKIFKLRHPVHLVRVLYISIPHSFQSEF
jgi:hypothetical protein